MKTIWKFPLDEQVNDIEMPLGARVLLVREQHERICVWVEVDESDQPGELTAKEKRRFVINGTGAPMYLPPAGKAQVYLGTAMLQGGNFVFHVYEHR